MKKNLYHFLFIQKMMALLIMILMFSVQSSAQWAVYNGSVLPEENDPAFGTSGLGGAGLVTALVEDADVPGNMLLQLLTLANGDNGTWRRVHGDPVSDITIVMRVKSADDNGRRVLELDVDNGGFRERLYINQEDNKLRLQHSAGFGSDNEFSLPEDASVKDWNIYRLTKDAQGNVKLYVNENPEPLAEGTTGQTTSNNHFRFGDTNGSHNISALIDWVIWDTSGVYAPGEGTPIPAELLPEEPVEDSWFVYDASVLPAENDPSFGTSGNAGAGLVTTLVEDPANAENSLLQLLTIANGDNGTWRQVYADPVTDVTIVFRVKAADENGRRVLEMDVDNGGFRERLYINQEDNKLRLQHSAGFGSDNEFSLPDGASVNGWNIYRITKDAEGNVKLYVNENAEPLAAGKSSQSTSNNHFRFGDTNGSHNISALVDWVIWDTSGVFAPGEGNPIPAGLDISFDLPEEPEAHNWRIYDGRNLPTDQIPVFDTSNVGGAGGQNSLVADPDAEGNSFLEFSTAANGDNFMWRTQLQPETPAITMVFRAKAANNESRRVVELDLHHNGYRERMYINREFNRLRLNEGIGGGDGGEIAAPEGIDFNNWNIYRLTMTGNETRLYLNENPEPIATGTTNTTTTQQYFRFGDGNSSHNAAALIDWIVWDETGAYAPGEGSAIPQNVKTPNWDASLSEIRVGGEMISAFDPEVAEYDVALDAAITIAPEISALVNDQTAQLNIIQASSVPGNATIDVTAANGFTVAIYTVTFRYKSSDARLQDLMVADVPLEGFDAGTINYSIELPQGTTEAPIVSASATDGNATVVITQAQMLPGEATITVTAEDGTVITYTIEFTLDTTSANVPEDLSFKVYPNPASAVITVELSGSDKPADIRVMNMHGQVMMQTTVHETSHTINISGFNSGMYILQVIDQVNTFEKMFIKR